MRKEKRRYPFPLVFVPQYAANFIRGEDFSDSETVLTYYRERKKYEKLISAFNDRKLVKDRDVDLSFCKLPPFPYQELPILIGLAVKHIFFHIATGLGKTYISGYIMLRRLLTGKAKKLLVICPKVGVEQWKKELIKFFDFPENWLDEKIIITNYEALYDHTNTEAEPVRERIYPHFLDVDAVIIDESHLIKNPTSLRAAVVAEICKNAKYRIAMTGTPIRNQALDLFFQLSIINPWAFKMSYWNFLKQFFVKIETGRYTKYQIRPQKLHILSEIAHKNMLKIEKQEGGEFGKESISYTTYQISPTEQQVALSVEVATEVLRKGDTLVDVKNSLMKIQQISSGFLQYKKGNESYIDRFHSPKLDKAIQLVTDYAKQGEKVVVFAKFIETISRLQSELIKRGIRAEVLTGKLNKTQEEKVKQSFMDGPAQVLIIQLQKGEHTLNLQVARRVVFVEYDWSPASVEQAIGRVHRKGQTRKVFVDFLVTKGLIDDKILKTVKTKTKVNMKALRVMASRLITELKLK